VDETLFGSIIELITRLSYDEKEKVILTVQNIMSNLTEGNAKLIGELREKKYSKGFSCPHCSGTHVVRYGKFKGRQRYMCKDCIKTFSDLTDTPLARTRYPELISILNKTIFPTNGIGVTADLFIQKMHMWYGLQIASYVFYGFVIVLIRYFIRKLNRPIINP